MPRVHAVTDGTPESVEADLAVMPRRVRTNLLHQLAEGERIVIRTRQHPSVLVRYLPWPVLNAWLWWWLVVDVKAAPRLIDLVFVGFLVGLARLGWMELQRRFRWFVATNKRILKHEGVLSLSVPMMRLTKVTDMTYHRSFLGEILGYGTIVIESAGQQQAIRELTHIPDPDDVNAALNSEIFGEKPREKRRRRAERAWPKLPRRSRRRGDPPDDEGPGGPPRGGGPGPAPRDDGPGTGGVEVSPAGHPPMPRSSPETWYRSSNLRPLGRLGDTGEIPVVRAEDLQGDADRGDDDRGDDVRAIPLYPPREWVDEPR